MKLSQFSAGTIDGQTQSLEKFSGQVVLVVNVASECGFTPQYEGLQALYEKFNAKGFVVLGFPCNQFGAQEPGSEAEIKTFCETKFGIKFPMFAKVEVNGANTHPLFAWLKSASPGILNTEAIKWNFTKFLIGRDGTTVERFAPQATPASLESAIEKALAR